MQGVGIHYLPSGLKTILSTPNAKQQLRKVCPCIIPRRRRCSWRLSPVPFSVEDLMHLACSSVFCGGGTNQELAHHCLYECKGDIMVSAKSRTARPSDKAAVCATDWEERLSHCFPNTAPRLASLKICIDTFRCKVSHNILRSRKLDYFFSPAVCYSPKFSRQLLRSLDGVNQIWWSHTHTPLMGSWNQRLGAKCLGCNALRPTY